MLFRSFTPLDPTINLGLPADFAPIVSEKDAAAPTLDEALAAGLLPDYAACLAFRQSLHA